MKLMQNNKCLYCYRPLHHEQGDYHPACSRKFFGSAVAPQLPYYENDLPALATEVIKSHTAVPGVQSKLSLQISKQQGGELRFTIMGLWSGYILKPQSTAFANLPEIEDTTMHLAQLSKIYTVQHALIRMKGGNLAYITKREDRPGKNKLHMEDMCQLTERLTEDKYRGSYEQIAKAIAKYSANPGLDLVNFYEQVIFSFLTGNADMHLKNFSLINYPDKGYVLCPAYDMVATALVVPGDTEELALNLNGKKRRLKRMDFMAAMMKADLSPRVIHNIFKKFEQAIPLWLQFIGNSFLPPHVQQQYVKLIYKMAARLDLEIN